MKLKFEIENGNSELNALKILNFETKKQLESILASNQHKENDLDKIQPAQIPPARIPPAQIPPAQEVPTLNQVTSRQDGVSMMKSKFDWCKHYYFAMS